MWAKQPIWARFLPPIGDLEVWFLLVLPTLGLAHAAAAAVAVAEMWGGHWAAADNPRSSKAGPKAWLTNPRCSMYIVVPTPSNNLLHNKYRYINHKP